VDTQVEGNRAVHVREAPEPAFRVEAFLMRHGFETISRARTLPPPS
jgi:hypothetical protein